MKPAFRHRSRKLAMQALYEWEMAKNPVNDISAYYIAHKFTDNIDKQYFLDLFFGTTEHIDIIDNNIQQNISNLNDIKEITTVELSVLRLAIFELIYKLDVPFKVVINEALEITKKFGTQDGFKFVNGVLDKLSKKLRPMGV